VTVGASRVTVRRAEPAEYAEIGRVTVAAYRAAGMIPEGSGYGDQLADAAARAKAASLLVATAEGRILGNVAYCEYGSAYAEISRPGEAEFRMLAVDPEAQTGGVGEALVRAVIERARSAGVTAVVLSTPEIALPAQRLYARLGFLRLPERDWSPVPGVNLLGYRLQL
jgi:ribosomal protein S18 acetylase RimI-like enzyme